jgi:hypothetical protein
MADEENKVEDYWIADAANIDTSSFDIERYITTTPLIDEFVASNKFIVAAPKGYGKTLLLKYKRLHNHDRFNDQSPITVPSNTEIDTLDNPIPFDDGYLSYLKDAAEWETLWQVAIGLSVILHYSIGKKEEGAEFISDFLDDFEKNNKLSNLVGLTSKIASKIDKKASVGTHLKTQANPSSLLAALLTSPLSDLRASIGQARTCITQWCLSIDRTMLLYVDKIDEGVRDYPLDLWRNAQNGVVGAIFRLHNANRHIKIYSTIRIEAWECSENELHAQYDDHVCVLSYTHNDLLQIFQRAVRVYESKKTVRTADAFNRDPIHAFVGVEHIDNTWANQSEDVFPYMLRHSLQRPRDLILLGKGVHELFRDNRRTEREFCKLVNRIPGVEVRQQYFPETFRFSASLRNVNLQRFFSITNKNIFSLPELVDICARYNGDVKCKARTSPKNHTEHCRDCLSANHIFCDLYRIGLLGIIKCDEVKHDKSKYQSFLSPGHVRSEHLPDSSCYLLHPAMDYYIKEEQANNLFSPTKGIIVGQGKEWLPQYDALLLLDRIYELFRTSGIPVSEQITKACDEVYGDLVPRPVGTAIVAQDDRSKKIRKLRELVSSDGLLSATNFVSEIFGVLEKLQSVIK